MSNRARRVANIAASRGRRTRGLGPGESAGAVTFDDMTVAGTAQIWVSGAGAVTFDDMTVAGTATIEDAGETLTITLPAATWDVSVSAFRTGTSGSNYFGAFVAIPSGSVGDHAFYFTHDGRGWDPQPHNASLTGYTMHVVALGSGPISPDDVATALAAVMSGVYAEALASADEVAVTDDIDAGGAFTGIAIEGAGAAGAWGCREDDIGGGGFDGNPIANGLHAYSEYNPGAPGLVTGLATRLAAAGDLVRMSLYVGGTAASGGGGVVNPTPDLDDTVRLCQTTMTGSGTGWVCQPLPPAEVEEIPDGTPIQYALGGETSTTHASFRSTGNMGDNDLAAQQLAVFNTTDFDPDPTVSHPATLEGVAIDASFAVALMVAFEYRLAPHRGDAGGITLVAS